MVETGYYKIYYDKWYGKGWSKKIFASSEDAAIEIFKMDCPDKEVHAVKLVAKDSFDTRKSLL